MPWLKKYLPLLIFFFFISLLLGFIKKDLIRTKTIEQINPTTEANAAYKKCNNSTNSQNCYAEFFSQLTKAQGIAQASSTVEKLLALNAKSGMSCHFIAHKIAQAEIQKNPNKWKDILKEVSLSDCSSGYIHGILEAHLAEDPNFIINSKTIAGTCQGLKLDTVYTGIGCYHAMGHLLLVQDEGKVPIAASECNKFNAPIRQKDCLMGTFMEAVIGENLQAHGIIKKRPVWNQARAAEIEKLCSEYSGIAQEACWRQIAHIYSTINHANPEGVYNDCKKAPTESLTNACFLHGIAVIMNQIKPYSAEFHKVCNNFPETNPLFKSCIQTVISSTTYNSAKNSDVLLDFCSHSYSTYRKYCNGDIIIALKRFKINRDTINQVCRKITKEWLPNECLHMST